MNSYLLGVWRRFAETGALLKRISILVSILVLSGVALRPQTPENAVRDFAIDVSGSQIDFFVGSSSGDVTGALQPGNGSLHLAAPEDAEGTTLKFEVPATTLSTEGGAKETLVKGRNFFDVKDFPTVSFTSTNVIPSSDRNKFEIQGNLLIRGVTKPVILHVSLDPANNGTGRIYADLSFDRRDFGMNRNVPSARVSGSFRMRLDLNVVPASIALASDRYSWTKVVRITVSK